MEIKALYVGDQEFNIKGYMDLIEKHNHTLQNIEKNLQTLFVIGRILNGFYICLLYKSDAYDE